MTFKQVPHSVFGRLGVEHLATNVLVLNVQPRGGDLAHDRGQAAPAPKLCLASLTLDLDYRAVFGEEPPQAYERLLLDVMLGDQTLFVRSDGVETAWGILDGLHEDLGGGGPLRQGVRSRVLRGGLLRAPAGADELLALDGRAWRPL